MKVCLLKADPVCFLGISVYLVDPCALAQLSALLKPNRRFWSGAHPSDTDTAASFRLDRLCTKKAGGMKLLRGQVKVSLSPLTSVREVEIAPNAMASR